ncbi:MAG: PLP-dependent aminotransferase family protein [Elainellaceae cyanobacterium]
MNNNTSVKTTPLYEQVAARIAHLIQQGTLQSGDRIPSVRQLCKQLGVSVSTVLEAYRRLESEGLVEARPQSGYYVRSLPQEPEISDPEPIATEVGIGYLLSEILASTRRRGVVPLGVSEVSPELLPTQRLNQVMSKVARHADISTNSYDFPPGNEDLRRCIARRSLRWGGSLSADDIVITCGCMESINLCLRAVTKAGDTIIVESPAPYGFLEAMESLGIKALELPTSPREGISIEALQSVIQNQTIKACLLMPNFNNPLGSCMPEANKQRLVEILTKAQIPLIEDDAMGELYFSEHRPKPAKAFDTEGIVLLCSSFSKDLAPGYRVGWVVPGRFQPQVERLKHLSNVANPTLPQLAIAEFLKTSSYDRHLRQLRRTLAAQTQQIIQAVGEYFPSETKVTRPMGGTVVWVELPKGVDALELYQQALLHDISIVPGHIFSTTKQYQNYIRINCGYPWSSETEQSIARLGRLAKQQLV